MKNLYELEPKKVFSFFYDLTQCPRPSGKEDVAMDYLKKFAKDRGFAYFEDKARNLLIKVPATPGYENAPCVMIQGHSDMVTEKSPEVVIDFEKDPIQTYVDGDWIKAKGTTLGADNGIGIAMGLAVADDPSCKHGPLEILVTVEEETGLGGAEHLDLPMSSANMMLNIDTEEDGVFYIGCAGGIHIECKKSKMDTLLLTKNEEILNIEISGFKGGHSGLNIIENRGNAIKVLEQLLMITYNNAPFSLISIQGGTKHNAIPRECSAVIAVPKEKSDLCKNIIEKEFNLFVQEYAETEKGLACSVSITAQDTNKNNALTVEDTKGMLQGLLSMPHGVQTMTPNFGGMVETSCNHAIVRLDSSGFYHQTSVRSTVKEARDHLAHRIQTLSTLSGWDVEIGGSYPPWRPDLDAKLLKEAQRVWKKVFQDEAGVKSIHAGLECGTLMDKFPGVEAISIGPNIEGAHSPEEKLSVSSTQKVWKFVKSFLEDVAEKK